MTSRTLGANMVKPAAQRESEPVGSPLVRFRAGVLSSATPKRPTMS